MAGTIASIGLKFSDSATFKREALLLLIFPRTNINFVTCMIEKRARGKGRERTERKERQTERIRRER